MRMWFVAVAVIVLLLVSAVAVQGSWRPWTADFPAADGSQYHARDTPQNTRPGPAGQSGGLTSVDFLGQIRKQLDIGHMISMFPFSWSGGASNTPATDRVKFLGNTYEGVNASALPGSYYYTGEQYGGRRIYVSAAEKSPSGSPDYVYLKEGDRYATYAITGRPAVYAYVPGGAFNAGEPVRFGVANDGAGSVELPNAAPFEVQREENGRWQTIFSPVAAQVITKLNNGSRLSWEWDQRLDGGTLAPAGDYRVVIAGRYEAPFRVAGDVPVVEVRESGMDRAAVQALETSSPAVQAFRKAWPATSAEAKEDITGIMQYKAWALGLDAEQLRKAIVAADDGLPCMAVHASYDGQPAWIILFSPSPGTSAPAAYVVDESSGKVAFRP